MWERWLCDVADGKTDRFSLEDHGLPVICRHILWIEWSPISCRKIASFLKLEGKSVWSGMLFNENYRIKLLWLFKLIFFCLSLYSVKVEKCMGLIYWIRILSWGDLEVGLIAEKNMLQYCYGLIWLWIFPYNNKKGPDKYMYFLNKV